MHHRIVSVLRRLQNAPARQLDRPEILDACRHSPQFDQPEATLDAIARFCASVAAGTA